METNQKEIIWTKTAIKDLNKIYEFNTPVFGEEKSFNFIVHLIEEVNLLEDGYIAIGARYRSKRYPELDYRKLVSSHYLIIYRAKGKKVYINKIFDTRQNPKKLKL